jgi:hypothetical protein
MRDADMVTGAEFGRWRSDFAAFQERLETRLNEGFGGLNGRLDELNGRTRKNTEELVAVDTRLDQLEPIGTRVQAIQERGCAQLATHRQLLATDAGEGLTLTPARWTKKKQALVGGGLVASGAALLPLLQEILRLFHDLLVHFGM